MVFFKKLMVFIDRTNDFFLKVASILALLLVLLTTQQVIFRYLFKANSVAMQELQWHLFGAMFLLATPAVLRLNEHVRVDILYSRLNIRLRALIDSLGLIFFLIPTALVFYSFGIDFVSDAFNFANTRPADYYTSQLFSSGSSMHGFFSAIEGWLRKTLLMGEISPDPGGLEGRWILKSMIPFSAVLLGLQAISQLTKTIPQCFWEHVSVDVEQKRG